MAANGGATAAGQLSQKEAVFQMMLLADVHLGTRTCNYQMDRYVFKRRNDDVYSFNLGKTWETLLYQSARPYGQRAVLKFSQYTGANGNCWQTHS